LRLAEIDTAIDLLNSKLKERTFDVRYCLADFGETEPLSNLRLSSLEPVSPIRVETRVQKNRCLKFLVFTIEDADDITILLTGVVLSLDIEINDNEVVVTNGIGDVYRFFIH
jgi:hypothetical protein